MKIQVEEILSSRGRVKILKLLALLGELNISELARKAGLSHTSTERHLNQLKKYNLVIEKRFGRIRIFKFNAENPLANAIAELFRRVEELSNERENNDD